MFNVVMSIEVDSPPGFVITLVTMNNSIWTSLYLLLVPFLVQSQMLLFSKNTDRLLTAIAVKLLILMLSSHVCVQVASLREAPLTVGTFELVMLYVLDPVVFVQDAFGAECSWTKCAFESNTFVL